MDTAMRDLERLEERDDAPGRRLGTLLMAALATVALVFAVAILLGGAGDAGAEAQEDPLSALDRAAGFEVDDLPIEDAEAPEVDRRNLAFPETLAEYDTRPEVEAALAAAAAELEHPEPIPSGVPLGDIASGSVTEAPVPSTMGASWPLMPVDDSLPAALPASAAIGDGPEALSRARAHDPLVAAAFPREAARDPVGSGSDGEYTIQVISYQHPTDANVFADGLRARGHHAFVMAADIPDRGRFYRVRIGPFETQREADAYRRDFEDQERMNTLVVRRRDRDDE
jgi:cell division septation protein DedD